MVAMLILGGCGRAISRFDEADESPRTEYQFASEDRLSEHWLKHGREFGVGVTKDQYLAMAVEFFKDRSAGKELKSRPNGDELHYKSRTNEFGVLTGDLVIRTYFKPSAGRSYWERQ